jgi:crotonobetainyl-CoA:carnitine CoA-transferase CaiB-like acyl-CoA transferase
MSNSLLDGIRILDLTRVLAGPFCTQMLGDLGADVIKVEATGRGDDTRHWGPPFTEAGESAYFMSANRNKRSLTLNLKSKAGLDILRQLIAQADVLVENFRTGTLAKWGLDWEALQAIKPDLIYCTITGYGYTGPYADRPGYDFMVQAMGGFMSVTGPADGEPVRAGVAITDLMTGTMASNAIMGALFNRERTGQGHRLDIALLDSQLAMMSYVAMNYLVSGENPGRFGNGHPSIVPYQEFKAKDSYFAFAAGNDGQWGKFCRAIDKLEWTEDPRYATNVARVENRAEVVAMLNEVFGEKDAAEWMALCTEIGIPSAPINTFDKVFADPQVIARGLQQEAVHPTVGVVPMVASPLNVTTAPPTIRYAPPLLGEHSDEILSEALGATEAEIDKWRKNGVI